MILKRYNDDNINENRDYIVHKPQVEIDKPTVYPDGWKEMDGIFMHPKNEEEQKKEIIERLSDHWKDKLNNELIIPKSLFTYTLDELITLENYYINENKTIWDKHGHNLPKIFTYTKYGLPSDEDLKDINQYNLSSEDIIQGFGYTIIGRGIQSSENINNIVKSIKMLCDTYPDNKIYEEALSKVKIKYNINESSKNTDPVVKQLGIIDYYERLIKLLNSDKYEKITKNKKDLEKRINNLFNSYHIYTGSYNDISDKENLIDLMKKINDIIKQYDIEENNLKPFDIDKINFDRFNLKENMITSDNLLETLKELKHIHMSNEAVEDIRIENNEIVFDVKCETDIQATSEYNGVKLNFNKLCDIKNINESVSFEDEMTEEQIIEHARMVKTKTIDDFLSDIYEDTIIEQAKLNTIKCFKDFFNEVKKDKEI